MGYIWVIFPIFQNWTCWEKLLKDNKHNSLHLGGTILVYCPWTLSVPRSLQFSNNLVLLATDDVRGQIFEHISAPNGSFCLHSRWQWIIAGFKSHRLSSRTMRRLTRVLHCSYYNFSNFSYKVTCYKTPFAWRGSWRHKSLGLWTQKKQRTAGEWTLWKKECLSGNRILRSKRLWKVTNRWKSQTQQQKVHEMFLSLAHLQFLACLEIEEKERWHCCGSW